MRNPIPFIYLVIPAIVFALLGTLPLAHVFGSLLGPLLFFWSTKDKDQSEVRRFGNNGINCVALSPDGRFVLCGNYDGTLRLWEANTGKEVRKFVGHSAFVLCVAYSPDGQFAVSGGIDKTLRLWNIGTGEEIKRFTGHTGAVNSVAFSPDGRFVISGGSGLSFSEDGRFVIPEGGDHSMRLWDVDTGKEVRVFEAHTDGVSSVAYSKDGRFVLSGCWDHWVRLWDVGTGAEIRRFYGDTSVSCVAFSPDGRYALSGGGSSVRLWDVQTGEQIRSFGKHSNVTSVAFSPNGQYALSASREDQWTCLWDVQTGKRIRSFYGPHTGFISISELWNPKSVAFSPDGRYAIAGFEYEDSDQSYDDGMVVIWRLP